MSTDTLIIGAGPAGLAAAAFAPPGALVMERRKEPGWKILISGGGHANVTNTLPKGEFLKRLGAAGRFLKHAIHPFGPEEVRAFLKNMGCPTTRREEGHVYPSSNRAGDVLAALLEAAARNAATVYTAARVGGIERAKGGFVVTVKGEKVRCGRLLVAAGTPAYDRARGAFDGIIRGLGHTVRPWTPGLAPVGLAGNPFEGLDGVSFTGRISVEGGWGAPGEIVITDEGLSGPAALDASAAINRGLSDGGDGRFLVDFLPARSREATLEALFSLRKTHPRAAAAKAFEKTLPKRLAARLVLLATGETPPPTASQLTREAAGKIADTVHACPLTVAGIPPLSKGFVASGGIPLAEVNPRTMESKIVKGLYFAGEILDYDAPTGGFNITIALSTGRLAGVSMGTQGRG